MVTTRLGSIRPIRAGRDGGRAPAGWTGASDDARGASRGVGRHSDSTSGGAARAGVTHWSARRLADRLAQERVFRVTHDSIAVLWRQFCLQPHRSEGFKFSPDPAPEATICDVVGPYLDPPQGAVVVCVDKKSQIQALDPTAPMLPMRPRQIQRHAYDDTRHGTTTLFAALKIAAGTVVDAGKPRHRHTKFLAFLNQLAQAYPRVPLHVVCDNHATHKHSTVNAWLARHPRMHLRFTHPQSTTIS